MKAYTISPKENDVSCDALKDILMITSKYMKKGINKELNLKIMHIVEPEYFKRCLFSESIPLPSYHFLHTLS